MKVNNKKNCVTKLSYIRITHIGYENWLDNNWFEDYF